MQENSETKLSYWAPDTSRELVRCTIGDLLRRVAAEVPDRIALVDGVADVAARRRWTYRALLQEAERVARALLGFAGVGDRIAVYAPNCVEWVILQHGVALAGMVLVPVNPAYAEKELRQILLQADVSAIFVADEYRGKSNRKMVQVLLDGLDGRSVVLKSFSEWQALLDSADTQISLPMVNCEDVSQLQFTSGTTGVPKGACLHHLGVVNTSRFVAERAEFPDGGVWINAMPLFHIGGSVVTELGTINARGTYVVVPAFDPDSMLDIIESERGNATLVVPTMIIAMLERYREKARNLSSLITLLTGAAEVPASLVRQTKQEFGCGISILFGQTEINGVVSQTRLSDRIDDQAETLGQPLPQVEVCIKDRDSGAVVPRNEVGEICVRGYQKMHGYLGMEEATRETIDADGWLHMGDLGVMDSRGFLRIAGRIKDMIIRGGMNIYPREVEDVLFDHPQVAQVSVVAVPDGRWGEVVGAVVIAGDAASRPQPQALFNYCRERLAPHKAPVYWYFVDEFPVTPSGKVQKFILARDIKEGRLKPEVWERG